jgi:hypothetical protein
MRELARGGQMPHATTLSQQLYSDIVGEGAAALPVGQIFLNQEAAFLATEPGEQI